MKAPYLENGSTGFFNDQNEWQCTGSMMGRRTIIPDDYNGEKLHLRHVPFVDGCYDQGGAYWGTPANLYCAWGETETEQMQVFVRASSREAAKKAVADSIKYKTSSTPKFHR